MAHDYLNVYKRLFEPLRDEPITLLELGYAGGASPRVWRDYFTEADIVMLDIERWSATSTA